MPDTRPNVLVIMSDQHHAGIMGCAGDPIVQTPALDGLARQGVRLGNAYCPFPLCGPSRMAFMTGRHCSEIDVWTNNRQLHSNIPTFAHAFTASGYRTALIGRMHFVGPDQRHGFLERPVADVPASVHIEAGWQLKEVLGDFTDTPGCSLPSIVKSGPGHTGYHAYDETVTDATVKWLREHAAGKERSPFMSVVGFVSPHCPFIAPPDDFAYYAERIGMDDLPEPDEKLHAHVRDWARQSQVDPPPPRDAQWRTRVAYYGLCTFTDRLIGRVLETLEATGLAENTIVVYTSDHGEMLGEHGLWWKSTFYDGASRVPLLVRWPERLPTNRYDARNCSLIDIGPTLLDLAGLPALPKADGASLRPLLEGRGAWHDTAFCEYANPGSANHPVVACRFIRRGPWKYNYYHGLEDELYNLESDPGESCNRIDDPDCAALAEELRLEVLRDWDPDYVVKRLCRFGEEQSLIATCIRRAALPEPDPVWFKTPPRNVLFDAGN